MHQSGDINLGIMMQRTDIGVILINPLLLCGSKSLFLISKRPWWSSGFASQAEGHSFKPRLVSLSIKINVQNFLRALS